MSLPDLIASVGIAFQGPFRSTVRREVRGRWRNGVSKGVGVRVRVMVRGRSSFSRSLLRHCEGIEMGGFKNITN